MKLYRDLTLDQLVDVWRKSELERVLNSPTVVFHNGYTPVVTHYRWYADGTESGSTALANEDTSYTVTLTANTTLHIRMLLREAGGDTGQPNATSVILRANRNGAGFLSVGSASPKVRAAGSGSGLTQGAATTNRATGLTDPTGTFIAGVQSEEADGTLLRFTTVDEVTAGNFTEYVFAISVTHFDAVDGDSITFDFTENGTPPTFSFTPTLIISKPIAIGPRSVTLTGAAPTISLVTVGGIEPGAGSVALTGYTPVAQYDTPKQPGSGSIALSGSEPVATLQLLTPTVAGALTLAGAAPSADFAPGSRPGAGAIALSGFAPLYLGRLTPTSDVSAGAWTNEAGSGSNLYASIDESSASDADYIISESSPSASIVTFALPPKTDPGSNDNHVVRYRYKKEGTETVDITVRLKQDTTVIKSTTHSDISTGFVEGAMSLSAAEASAITDYSMLRLEFEASVS